MVHAMWIRVVFKPWNVKQPTVYRHPCLYFWIFVYFRNANQVVDLWLLPCCPAAQQAVGLWVCHVSILKPCELSHVQKLWHTGFVSHLNSICRAYLALDCKLDSTLEKSKARPCSKISKHDHATSMTSMIPVGSGAQSSRSWDDLRLLPRLLGRKDRSQTFCSQPSMVKRAEQIIPKWSHQDSFRGQHLEHELPIPATFRELQELWRLDMSVNGLEVYRACYCMLCNRITQYLFANYSDLIMNSGITRKHEEQMANFRDKDRNKSPAGYCYQNWAIYLTRAFNHSNDKRATQKGGTQSVHSSNPDLVAQRKQDPTRQQPLREWCCIGDQNQFTSICCQSSLHCTMRSNLK